MLDLLKDIMREIAEEFPYQSFNLKDGLYIRRNSSSTFFSLNKSEQDELKDLFYKTLNLDYKNYKLTLSHSKGTLSPLTSFFWVYAALAPIKTGDCVSLSKIFIWKLFEKFKFPRSDLGLRIGFDLKKIEIIELIYFKSQTLSSKTTSHACVRVNKNIIIDPWHRLVFTLDQVNTFRTMIPITFGSTVNGRPLKENIHFSISHEELRKEAETVPQTWLMLKKNIHNRLINFYDLKLAEEKNMPYNDNYLKVYEINQKITQNNLLSSF